jgi:DNA-3-methyladenine glycosylase I
VADPAVAAPPVAEAGRRAESGPDGRLRCPWSLGSAEYCDYHDDEWGRPVHDDQGMFERLCLEAFQSGLSWLTILRKRENFRAAFRGFDIAAVAAFGPADVARLLGDAGIVRNRAKIEAVIRNAQAAQALPGGLAALVWQYADAPAGQDRGTKDRGTKDRGTKEQSGPASTADIPSWTPASKALSRDLRRRGFTFTGPVTAYATLQACGVVDDHLAGCFRRGAYS